MALDVWTHPDTGIGVPPQPAPPEADLRYVHAIVVRGARTTEPYNFRDRETVWNNAGWGPSRVPFTLATAQANSIDYSIGRDDTEIPWTLRPIFGYPTLANRPRYFEVDLQSQKGAQPYTARVHEPSYGPSGYLFP